MSTLPKMPATLPLDVGQAILALRAELKQLIGASITAAFNAPGGLGDLPAIKRQLGQLAVQVEALATTAPPAAPATQGTAQALLFKRRPGGTGRLPDEQDRVLVALLPKIGWCLNRTRLKTDELAALMGVTSRTIYRWHRGQTAPQPRLRDRLIGWIQAALQADEQQAAEWREDAARILAATESDA